MMVRAVMMRVGPCLRRIQAHRADRIDRLANDWPRVRMVVMVVLVMTAVMGFHFGILIRVGCRCSAGSSNWKVKALVASD
jgi:hypothetical protein